ncbi:hypothetical protein, partial [Streptococcus agalactiae]|uniref:hypothetical protein n=1 Tax=Streptococcus agalactiae TaxID=1311 RepID=UPI001F3803F2
LVEYLVWDQGVAGSNPVFPMDIFLWYIIRPLKTEQDERMCRVDLHCKSVNDKKTINLSARQKRAKLKLLMRV